MRTSPRISLRKVNFSDIEFLWYLRNQPDVHQYYKEKRKVDWQEHVNWIMPIILELSPRVLFLIKKEVITIGQVRFDFNNKKAIISIAILKEFRCKGIAKKSIEKAIKLIKKERKLEIISARIHKKNIPSQKLFESLGFKTKNKKNVKWLNYERKIN